MLIEVTNLLWKTRLNETTAPILKRSQSNIALKMMRENNRIFTDKCNTYSKVRIPVRFTMRLVGNFGEGSKPIAKSRFSGSSSLVAVSSGSY